jgi:hypothetical protein
MRMPPQRPTSSSVTVQALLLWGANDIFLSREMARVSIEQCQQGQLVMFEEATHWVHYKHQRGLTDRPPEAWHYAAERRLHDANCPGRSNSMSRCPRAALGPLPGWLMLCVGVLFNDTLVATALVIARLHTASGEIMTPRETRAKIRHPPPEC